MEKTPHIHLATYSHGDMTVKQLALNLMSWQSLWCNMMMIIMVSPVPVSLQCIGINVDDLPGTGIHDMDYQK